MSRMSSLKRKRDIFEASTSNLDARGVVSGFGGADFETTMNFNTTQDGLETDFNFLGNFKNVEESYMFKFTSNEGPHGDTTGHLFDYDGNTKDSFHFRLGN